MRRPMGKKALSLKPGDRVTRLLAGEIPMKMTVTAVDDRLIHCRDWTFLRETGCEVDEELGWDGKTVTGSFLVEEEVADEH